MAFDRDEILNHDGLCGIERADWERSPVRAALQPATDADIAKIEANRESESLYGTTNVPPTPEVAPDTKSSLSQLGTRSEEPNGLSVAKLEANVNAGQAISLLNIANAVNAKRKIPNPQTHNPQISNLNNRKPAPKGKPTLKERLEAGKRKAAQHGQTNNSKNNRNRQEV